MGKPGGQLGGALKDFAEAKVRNLDHHVLALALAQQVLRLRVE